MDDHADDEHVHEESEHSSKKGGTSPDLEKQSKKDILNDLDGPSNNEEQRMASLKHVFKKALIYSAIFAAIVIIIGEFCYPRMILR